MTDFTPGAPRPKLHTFEYTDMFKSLQDQINTLRRRAVVMDCGTDSISPGGVNVPTTKAISFNRTFDNVPRVWMQFITGVTTTVTCFLWPSSITTTGFTGNINRGSGTTTSLYWFAIDLTNN